MPFPRNSKRIVKEDNKEDSYLAILLLVTSQTFVAVCKSLKVTLTYWWQSIQLVIDSIWCFQTLSFQRTEFFHWILSMNSLSEFSLITHAVSNRFNQFALRLYAVHWTVHWTVHSSMKSLHLMKFIMMPMDFMMGFPLLFLYQTDIHQSNRLINVPVDMLVDSIDPVYTGSKLS